MFGRLGTLLSLAFLAGCADELLIGNAHLDAGTSMEASVDAASDAGPDASAALDAEVDAGLADAGHDAAVALADAQQDAASYPLVAATQALFDTGAWLGQDFLGAALTGMAPINVQLNFVPAAGGEARGVFLGSCQGGCPFQQLRDAGVPAPRNSPIAFAGNFTLYHINEMGLVLGVLYTDDGFVRDLQFQWEGAGPIEAIFIEGPLGPITFVPLSSGRI